MDDDLDEVDLSLMMPIGVLYKEFICPICFIEITDAYMTPCGHNFCKPCIEECINRRHECPVCKAETTREQLAKNFHFDNLFGIVSEEKEKAAKRYYDNLISSATAPTQTAELPQATRSPIEQVFQTHMRRNLFAFEEYYGSLRRNLDAQSQQLRSELVTKISELRARHEAEVRQLENNNNLPVLARQASDDLIQRRIEDMTAEVQLKISELQRKFDACVSLLVDSYDRHLSQIPASPLLLPTTVTIVLPDRHLRHEVQLKCTDTIAEVRQILKMWFLNALGDPLQQWMPDSRFDLLIPFTDVIGQSKTVTITDESEPLGRFGMQPGSELIHHGGLQLKSDVPKLCFSVEFNKESPQAVDYFSCADCKFNWLCRACTQHCHQGHRVSPFLQNHTPSWGCCYCKKGKCRLLPGRPTQAS
eukprot:GILK01006970.1.p1 GENE.GILK01006970.1~~GILK01006970.1.p1  ORF type:complete len:432 (-),score=68.73 GILK01006970.1:269-1522(-)